jgi:hypothetical protein
MKLPIKISTDPNETEGLRSARMFDPEEAEEWFAYVRQGLKIGYEDRDTLERMAQFAKAIQNNVSDVYLSKETEAKISAFLNDPRMKF